MTRPSYQEITHFSGLLGKSPREMWLPDGHYQAVCTYMCDWDDRNILVSEIGKDGGELYPHWTGVGARAYAAFIGGFGKSGGTEGTDFYTASYDYALITVSYSTRGLEVSRGKFVTESIDPYEEAVRAPWQNLRWGSASGSQVEPNEAPILDVCGFVYTVTYHHVLSIPGGGRTLVGRCNGAAWMPDTIGVAFPAEYLLDKYPGVSRTIQLGSLRDWQYTVRLFYRSVPWNQKWSAENGWSDIYVAGGSKVFFHPPGNFDLLVP